MALTAEELSEILKTLRSEKRGKDEKRSDGRVGFRAKIQLLPMVQGKRGKPISVSTRDISRGGLCILTDHRPETGMVFIWELPQSGGGTKRMYASVRFTKQLNEGFFSVGLKFVDAPAQPKATISEKPKAVSAPSATDKSKADDEERIRRAILD